MLSNRNITHCYSVACQKYHRKNQYDPINVNPLPTSPWFLAAVVLIVSQTFLVFMFKIIYYPQKHMAVPGLIPHGGPNELFLIPANALRLV